MIRPSVLGSVLFPLVGTNVHAGTLTSATWLQVTSVFTLTRTTSQLSATGSSTSTAVAVSLSLPVFATTATTPGDPLGAVDTHVLRLTQGGAQAITATAGMGSGTPGIPGTFKNDGVVHGGGSSVTTFPVLRIPLRHGRAGQFTNTFTVFGELHTLTVDFFAWTPGTLTFTGLSSRAVPLPNVTVMGSFNLTPNGGGTVTLVSPSKLSMDGNFGPVREMLSITTLTLSFVPEPSTLLLLGGAALALSLVTRRGGARSRKDGPAPSREGAGPGR